MGTEFSVEDVFMGKDSSAADTFMGDSSVVDASIVDIFMVDTFKDTSVGAEFS